MSTESTNGSEIMGRKYRKQLALEICILQDRVKLLEQYTRDTEEVIPWTAVESALKSANFLAYLAGMVNGTKMARYEEMPRTPL